MNEGFVRHKQPTPKQLARGMAIAIAFRGGLSAFRPVAISGARKRLGIEGTFLFSDAMGEIDSAIRELDPSQADAPHYDCVAILRGVVGRLLTDEQYGATLEAYDRARVVVLEEVRKVPDSESHIS